MRKITAGLFMSLDGVVEAPEKWQGPYFNDEAGATLGASMAATETILLGRHTYQEFLGYWPNMGDDVPFAAYMNHTPKLVATTTLQTLDWANSSPIGEDAMEQLAKLRQEDGGNISVTGSPTLVRSLIAAGLLDELGLIVCPVVVGSGQRLFDGVDSTTLQLTESKTFATGALSLTYTLARQ
jgi:dihydrofolate reductase